jgi:hypothetical protein
LVLESAPGETPLASSINSKIAHLFVLDLLMDGVAQVLGTDRAEFERVS